jgi:hypothetical protein
VIRLVCTHARALKVPDRRAAEIVRNSPEYASALACADPCSPEGLDRLTRAVEHPGDDRARAFSPADLLRISGRLRFRLTRSRQLA